MNDCWKESERCKFAVFVCFRGSHKKFDAKASLIDNLIQISLTPENPVYDQSSTHFIFLAFVLHRQDHSFAAEQRFLVFSNQPQWRPLQPRSIPKLVENFTTEQIPPKRFSSTRLSACPAFRRLRCRTATSFSRADMGTFVGNLRTAKAPGLETNFILSSEESHVPSRKADRGPSSLVRH